MIIQKMLGKHLDYYFKQFMDLYFHFQFFRNQFNQLKTHWSSILTRSKQQRQKLEDSLSLYQLLSNVEKAFKCLAALKPSLSLETPLSTSIPQIDQQIKALNKAKSQLDSIEDDTEPVVKAGQKLLRTGKLIKVTMQCNDCSCLVFQLWSQQ